MTKTLIGTFYEKPQSEDGESEPVLIDEPAIDDGERVLRTQEDIWRAHIGRKILVQYVSLDALQDDAAAVQAKIDAAKLELSDIKAEIAGVNATLKSYVGQMRDIERGTFQPPLFDRVTGETLAPAKNGGALEPDAGGSLEIGRLIDHGLTGSMISALEGSQLAKEVPLKTVRDLERAIAADEWWFRKIKGFGETKVEKLIDALCLFRKENPIAAESDDRVKACTVPGCREEPGRGIYVRDEVLKIELCPVCGSKDKWELIEPDAAA